MPRPLWLFDLDNTLHDATASIFPSINLAMTRYVAQTLEVPIEEASEIRNRYWRRYGATLLGLVRHHSIDAYDFLDKTHRFEEVSGQHLEDLAQLVTGERGLRQALARLPGRKILLTNAPKNYAKKVLKELGIESSFFAIEAIEDMNVHNKWRPKPDQLMMRRLLRKYRANPASSILVDDTLGHLCAYSKIGIKTVWFKRHVRTYTHFRNDITLEVQSIHQLLNNWQRLI